MIGMSDARPRICFVAPNAYPVLAGAGELPVIGGAEVQQVLVARELARRGYPVSMICLDFGQKDELEIDGITVLRACRPDEGLPVLRFVHPRLTSMLGCLARADADIYYQRAAGLLTGIVTEFCRRNGRKSVFAAAGNPDLLRKTPRIRFARDRWFYEYGLRHVDHIVVQNEEQGRLCRVNFEREATLIPNCYPSPDGGPTQSGRVVLWVSTIRKLKRPELFLDLAEALKEYPFCMIGGPGNGERLLYEAIKARARAMPNVHFKGFVPFTRVEKFFSEAAIFVNTSESEGFPNTFLQSWARGVPTVSFVDCGARWEGRALGRQVDCMDEMVSCVRQWFSDEPSRAREGTRCQEYFERNHAVAIVVDLYEGLFRSLASTSSLQHNRA